MQKPAARGGASAKHALNCIVDDSALLAGLCGDGADDIRCWVRNGLVNIFVPLYTLDRLSSMRVHSPANAEEARKTLEWLDQITSLTENKSNGRVELQGPDHQYQTWQEVEKHLLPDTPLSSNHAELSAEMSYLQLEDQLHVDGSDDVFLGASRSANGYGRGSAHSIPAQVRPLLNFVVWRTHHSDSVLYSNGRYLLLTNDRVTQKQAQKFGVRSKLVSQLRNVFARDLHRMAAVDPQSATTQSADLGDLSGENSGADDDDDDEVVFHPTRRSELVEANVLDPDHFGRSPPPGPQPSSISQPIPITQSPKGRQRAAHSGASGSRGRSRTSGRPPFAGPRGRAATSTSPSASQPQLSQDGADQTPPTRGNVRGGAAGNGRTRGRAFTGRQRGNSFPRPIDPDSYARPPRMRGRGGRLWEPS